MLVNGHALPPVLQHDGVAGFHGVGAEEHGAVVHRLNGASFSRRQIHSQVANAQVQIVRQGPSHRGVAEPCACCTSSF